MTRVEAMAKSYAEDFSGTLSEEKWRDRYYSFLAGAQALKVEMERLASPNSSGVPTCPLDQILVLFAEQDDASG
jgi:hypothetical protein